MFVSIISALHLIVYEIVNSFFWRFLNACRLLSANHKNRAFEEVQAQREIEERAIWQSAHRIPSELGLDSVAVRNSMASSGVVEDEKKPVASGQET